MNGGRANIRMFLTTMLATVGGILPAAACAGGCGACFQCAGMGSVMALLAAIGMARREKRVKKRAPLMIHLVAASVNGVVPVNPGSGPA